MQTYLTLNDGNKIPQFGLGVFMIPEGKETYDAVLQALKLGIRHIDTAHAYQNERSVGKAIKDSGINREKIWITSKLWPTEYGEGKTLVAIDKMLKRLDTEYIDLLLLHQPVGDYLGAYKDMEKAVMMKKVRSIGLSNFESDRLEEVFDNSMIKPSALQVECHPYWQQQEVKEYLKKYGTVIESWYPIGHGDKGLIEEPIFTELANKYHKTNVQIILRWHLQQGNVVFPKTSNLQHLKDNFEIFDFELTDDEMKEIGKLDHTKRFYNLSQAEQDKRYLAWGPED